ncbi:angiopoietin-2-like [Anthonomus grandis grandis]|uniref:angiopoietin-2-like n=1 Tax=Anthonomus grandis grandis TaxID=2921223 RepID=UPI0021654E35|nr:angiopoietin-2-like [Anthonomus grandis grandis]
MIIRWGKLVLLVICAFRPVTLLPEAEHTKDNEENISIQFGTMKNTIKILSDQWEKWNTLFITSLEPRITSTASTISSIDSNIHNLQERAHVWDTFQLHVTAWNDQLASMDRKIDILNKGIEQLTVLDNKINKLLSDDYKMDKLIKVVDSVSDTLINIESGIKIKQPFSKPNKGSLFEEFAIRGILSSLKLVEKKVDTLISIRQINSTKTATDQLLIKCNSLENSVNDISSKVDVIFDAISRNNENSYSEDYIINKDLEGSGYIPSAVLNTVKNKKQSNELITENNNILNSLKKQIKDLDTNILNIDGKLIKLVQENRLSLNHNKDMFMCNQTAILTAIQQISDNISISETKNINLILDSYFHEDRTHWASVFNRLNKDCLLTQQKTINFETSTAEIPTTSFYPDETSRTTLGSYQNDHTNKPYFNDFNYSTPRKVDKHSCSDLDPDSPSGIYFFNIKNNGFSENERFFNKQYCETRDDGLWTVIQRRDNYTIQQDFNVSWHEYKLGFGNLQKDFWIGNNFLSRLSSTDNLTLRIELEDFDKHWAWAEYKEFKVGDEEAQFLLTIKGYSGNSTDSFSSHSGSLFSTYDRKNDDAPSCCPCSPSYGGGWWFNRCFESNLNGIYYSRPFINDYFRGIIWEHWLGNYSLKKSLMMVKSTGSIQLYSGPNKAVIEDP